MRPVKDLPRQLPLDLGHAVGTTRDDLVASPANAAAITLVDRWPNWPSPVVVLAGPTGAGKSHLAAIWRRRAAARQVAPAGIDALSLVGNDAAVLVEDIEPGGFDERALFHLINAVRQRAGHLLLTTRTFPRAWKVRLPDLESRLRAATVVEIAEPDDMLLAGVITKLFADRQVEVEPYVVSYLVSRIERSLATAGRVVERLDRAALEQQRPITRALAAAVLGASDFGQGDLGL